MKQRWRYGQWALAIMLGSMAGLALVAGRSSDAAAPAPPRPCVAHPRGAETVWGCAPAQHGVAGGVLLVPDSTADRVMSFDPSTGELLNPNLVPGDPAHLETPFNAILGPDGQSLLVSDQQFDVVQRYSFNGAYLGVFAPSTGVSTTLVDNPRGIALRPNGNLLVPVGGGANTRSVVQFSTAGVYAGQFITATSGGLDSPYDVFFRPSDILVGSAQGGAIRRYDRNTGAFLGVFAETTGFPQQLAQAANGNILVANFTTTNEGILEYTAAGVFVGRYDNTTLNSYRGVYELPNGNLLVSNPIGVREINRMGAIVDTKLNGVQARYIEKVAMPGLRLSKTVGLDPSSCAVSTSTLTVTAGTAVTYCYNVTNIGTTPLISHTLVDDRLGTLLNAFQLNLQPNASAFITRTVVINNNTVNTAIWRANDAQNVVVLDSDAAIVMVQAPTATPTATVTGTPPTATATATATNTATNTATRTATSSATSSATATATSSATNTATRTATSSATSTVLATPTGTATGTVIATPTAVTATPTSTVIATPTAVTATPTSTALPSATATNSVATTTSTALPSGTATAPVPSATTTITALPSATATGPTPTLTTAPAPSATAVSAANRVWLPFVRR